MGWTYTRRAKGLSHLEFFRRQWFPQAPDRLVDAAGVGYREVYLALRAERGYVLAVAVQTHWCPNDAYNFGWKESEEGSGPIIAHCPERILQLLSPIEDIYSEGRARDNAIRWRAQCRQKIRARRERPRWREGMIVEFPQPVRFADGTQARRLRVQSARPLRFSNPDGHSAFYRLPQRFLETADFRVIEAESVDEGLSKASGPAPSLCSGQALNIVKGPSRSGDDTPPSEAEHDALDALLASLAST